MLRNWFWRGGQLKGDQEYELRPHEAKVLLGAQVAVPVAEEPECTEVAAEERAVERRPKTRTRRRRQHDQATD